MIGQKNLLKRIEDTPACKFARFIILEGLKGSGRKLIAEQIAKKLKAQFIICGIKIDDVREAITIAYKQTEPTVFVFPDCDSMSMEAKNSLLKMAEEPARKSYIIMTVQSRATLPETLISRGYIAVMENYSSYELEEYINLNNYNFNLDERITILAFCKVPGQIETISQYDIIEFKEYCHNVAKYMHIVNGVNALKIPLKLKYKETDDGWDIELFLRGVVVSYVTEAFEDAVLYGKYANKSKKINEAIGITLNCLREINIKGANKKMLIDMWVLDVRKAMAEDGDN